MLEIRLLGYPRFRLDDSEIDNRQFRNQRGVALVAFLAMTGVAHSRDTLATILWPESRNAKQSLREVLSKIRTVIPEDYLDDDTRKLGLKKGADLWVDVVEFRRLLSQYPPVGEADPGDCDERIGSLTAADALYEDDFLNGFTLRGQNDFYYWQLEQSDQLREGHRLALKELVQCHFLQRSYSSAIIHAQRLVRIEPSDETANHMLMQAFALEGQRASALQQYDLYRQALEEEGLPLSDETTILYEEIQSGVFPPSDIKAAPRETGVRPAAETRLAADYAIRGDLRAKIYDTPGVIFEKPRRFIGRHGLLAEVMAACETFQHVLLTGLGGIGKTTLAATAAAEFLERHQGKVIWIEIVDAAPAMIFEAIARALDWNEILTNPSPQEQGIGIRQRLLHMNALVVLDNVWSGRSLFEIMKAMPDNIPVIVTSRRPIPLEGEIISLPDLDPISAVELLSYHAGVDYEDNSAASTLCHRLGHHPFNIGIAGKWLRTSAHLTPQSLLDEIAVAPHDLVTPGGFGEYGRESVKDLLDASANVLGPVERETLVAMGAFSSPYASLSLFSQLLQRAEGDVYKALVSLQQQGLVEVVNHGNDHPRHYRIHDLTYSYVCALYGEEGYDQQRVVSAVEQYVIERTQEKDYDSLDFDQVNILGAARSAYQLDDRETLIHIMEALVVEGYVEARGHSSILLDLLKQTIQNARGMGAGYKETLHYLLSKLGNIYAHSIGDYDLGVQTYQEALAVARDLNDTHREALLLSVIGYSRTFQDGADARDYLEEARELAMRTKDDRALSQILEHIGHYQLSVHDEAAARDTFAASLEVAERLQDHSRTFFALINLAASEKDFGHFDTALSLNQRAYEVAQHKDNKIWMAYALEGLGEAQDSLQERQSAQGYFDQALELYTQSGATAKADALIDIMRGGDYTINQTYLEAEGETL